MPEVKVNGILMHYEQKGTGDPVLLLHGLGSCGDDWILQIPELIPFFQLITVDLRGHGHTEKPPGPYSIRGFADDCVSLLQLLHIDKVHVIGLSLGCAVGFELAIHYPSYVKSLIGVNMTASTHMRSLKALFTGISRLLTIQLFGLRAMGKTIASAVFPYPDQAPLRQTLIERIAQNEKRAYLASLLALKGWSVEEELSQIRCPTLLIASEYDYSPVATKEAMVNRIPGASLVIIEKAHHVVPIEYPTKFNAVVLSFLQKKRTSEYSL